MGLALGVVCIWVGAACLWVATHGTTATTPWGAYDQVIKGLRGGD